MNKNEFFNRYSIDISNGRLGGGAFGTVYKAYDKLMDQWKAVKIAEVKYIGDKEFSLISEFEAANKLETHKNIANYESVFQFEMENGLFDYAVMQFYKEGNLKQLLANRKLGISEKIFIVNSLLSGIAFLHSNQIIHRDLKPSNILISEDHEGHYIPKIADFGLSKIIDDDAGLLISNSFQGGTLEYSPPEQLFGKHLSYNADLWSYGVICYEVLTSKRLFLEGNLSGSIDAKRASIYKNIVSLDISDRIKECPYPYDQLIELCLIKDPDQRAKTGADLISFLRSPSGNTIQTNQLEEDETFVFEKDKDQEYLNVDPLDPGKYPQVLRGRMESFKQNFVDFRTKRAKDKQAKKELAAKVKQEQEEKRRLALAEQRRKEEKEQQEREARVKKERLAEEQRQLEVEKEKRRVAIEKAEQEKQAAKKRKEEERLLAIANKKKKEEKERLEREEKAKKDKLERERREQEIENEKRRIAKEKQKQAEKEAKERKEQERRLALVEQRRKEEENRLEQEEKAKKERIEEERRQQEIENEKIRIAKEQKQQEEKAAKKREEEENRLALAEQKKKEKKKKKKEEKARKEKQEEERRLLAIAEQKEQLAKEKAEQELKLEKEKQEEERRLLAIAEQKEQLAKEKAEQELKLAKEKQEEERRLLAIAEQKEQLAKEKAEQELKLAKEKQEEERRLLVIVEQKEQLAKEKAEKELKAKEKQEEKVRLLALAAEKRKFASEKLEEEKNIAKKKRVEEIKLAKQHKQTKAKQQKRLVKEKAVVEKKATVTAENQKVEKQSKKPRKRILLALLFLMFSAISYKAYDAYKSGPIVFSENGKYGCKLENGEVILYPSFTEIGNFKWGEAIGVRGDSTFVVSVDGSISYISNKSGSKEIGEVEDKKISEIDDSTSVEDSEKIVEDDVLSEDEKIAIRKKKESIAAEMKQDYKKVEDSNDIKEMERFLLKWPKSIYQESIQSRIDKLVMGMSLESELELFEKLKSTRSKAIINKYLQKYPKGKYVNEVKKISQEEIRKEEESIWLDVVSLDQLDGYEKYIVNYPNSIHTNEARKKVLYLQEVEYWNRIKDLKGISEFESYLKKYPKGKFASEATKNITKLQVDNTNLVLKKELSDYAAEIKTKELTKEQSEELEDSVSELKEPNISKSKLNNIESKLKSLYGEVESNSAKLKLPPIIKEIEDGFTVNNGTQKYTLGCEGKGCQKDESPSVQVTIAPFAIGKYEVTQGLWKKIMGNNPSFYNDKSPSIFPVENVSYNEVKSFLAKLNAIEGNPYRYRLPTESEWEYAASANKNTDFAGSNDINKVAHYGMVTDGTAKVGSKKANQFQLFDMSGNVSEFTSDWYNKYDEKNKDQKYIVVRGGSWRKKSKSCRVKARNYIDPNDKNMMTGFRLVRELK